MIMKRIYRKPEITIARIEGQVLAGSVTSTGISGTPAGQPARSKEYGKIKWREKE
jgi:hypothetical protein